MSVDGYLIATCKRELKQTIGQYKIRHERSHLTNHLTVDHYELMQIVFNMQETWHVYPHACWDQNSRHKSCVKNWYSIGVRNMVFNATFKNISVMPGGGNRSTRRKAPPSRKSLTIIERGVLDTTWCDKVCQWLAALRWFSDHHSSFYLQNGFVSTLYIFYNLLWALAHLTERKCELFPSLGVRRLLTFHISLFFSETAKPN